MRMTIYVREKYMVDRYRHSNYEIMEKTLMKKVIFSLRGLIVEPKQVILRWGRTSNPSPVINV